MATTEATRERIQSFIFLKVGTTGRPWQDAERTKIVELCLIAVHWKDLARGKPKKMPAALKLNIVFSPNRRIEKEATDKQGLTDSYVLNAPRFEQCAGTIAEFLQSLPKPVCLVAHGGFAFDFKLLKEELEAVGINLPEDLLCADSIHIFLDILKRDYELKNPKKFTALTKLHELFIDKSNDVRTPAPKRAEKHVKMLLDCVFLNKCFAELADQKSKMFAEVKLVGGKKGNYKRVKRVKVDDKAVKKMKNEVLRNPSMLKSSTNL